MPTAFGPDVQARDDRPAPTRTVLAASQVATRWEMDARAASDPASPFEAKRGDWQEAGAGAFHFHGLTEQVPNTTTVYNTLFSGRDRIAGLDFEMIKVTPSRMGGAQESAGRRIGNLGRVVMDAVFDSARFGTLPKAYGWIRERIASKVFLDDLTESAIRHGDGPSRRRLGCALELLETDRNRLEKLEKSILPFRSFIPLVPGGDRRGHTNKKWGIILNHTDWLHDE